MRILSINGPAAGLLCAYSSFASSWLEDFTGVSNRCRLETDVYVSLEMSAREKPLRRRLFLGPIMLFISCNFIEASPGQFSCILV